MSRHFEPAVAGQDEEFAVVSADRHHKELLDGLSVEVQERLLAEVDLKGLECPICLDV